MRKKFIQCGFEFTASLKAKQGLKSNTLRNGYGDDIERGNEQHYDIFRNSQGLRRIHEISDFDWINENYSSDDCGCEVSTPIIKSKDLAIQHFNEFKKFVNKNNLTIDLHEAKCCLGGCHIHLGLETIPKSKRKLFLKNVAVFLTNNPQLNWAFNDPNDNINANSLLVDITNNGIHNAVEIYSDVDYARHIILMAKYEKDSNVLRAILDLPMVMELHKHYAFRYNEEYKTLELRIFDMPKSLEQHILHSDVAQAIFHYCLAKTKKGILGKLEYKNQADYQVPFVEAKRKFIKAMKDLGIDIKRTRHQMRILELRYEWNKMDKKDDYLL